MWMFSNLQWSARMGNFSLVFTRKVACVEIYLLWSRLFFHPMFYRPSCSRCFLVVQLFLYSISSYSLLALPLRPWFLGNRLVALAIPIRSITPSFHFSPLSPNCHVPYFLVVCDYCWCKRTLRVFSGWSSCQNGLHEILFLSL